MSSKRNRRGHRLIRRLAQSHAATEGDKYSFIFWSFRNDLCFNHYIAMCQGLDAGYDQFLGGKPRMILTSTPISRDDYLHKRFVDPNNINAYYGKSGINFGAPNATKA